LCRPIRVPSNILKELNRNNQNNNNNGNIKIDNNKTMDAHDNNDDDKIKQDHKDDHKDDDNNEDDKMLNRSILHKSWNPLYQWLKAKTTSSRASISKRTQAQYVWKKF
jgi:hypothetical protein